jgi:hypothetical protein
MKSKKISLRFSYDPKEYPSRKKARAEFARRIDSDEKIFFGEPWKPSKEVR